MSLKSKQATRLLDAETGPLLALQSYHLEMVQGPQAGKTWPVTEELHLGKGPENDIVIADATVSRNHIVLARTDSGFKLRDLGSTNGTFLDNAQIVEAYVRPGMEIRVGAVILRLRATHEDLNIEPAGDHAFGSLVGKSPAIRRIFALLEKVAPSDATILVTGETGTGKGAVARAIHEKSKRHDKPFVVVDCGAISRHLIESELFGHEKGAFTGAIRQRRGALEMCDGGTLFIDELDDLPIDIQPKLLRALEEREIRRVGANKPIKLDVRVIAATKKNLEQEVAQGNFREDLYYRLSIVTFTLPTLRERPEDIPLLADSFFSGTSSRWDDLPRALRRQLKEHTYPGNVRELRNLLERAMFLEGMTSFDPSIFPTDSSSPDDVSKSRLITDYLKPFKEAKESLVDRFEREYLKRLLDRNEYRIAKSAREAQIDRKYLYMLMHKHKLGPASEAD